MSEFYLGDYVYGAYLNFVVGSEGGGGGITPSAQTGDFLAAIIFAIVAVVLLSAIVVLFTSKFKKINLFSNSFSKVGAIAKSLTSKKVMLVSIIVAAILAVAAASFSVKAFASINFDNPCAPPYSVATGTMDKSSNTITVPTVIISDEAVKETEKYACIKVLSLKGLDQFANKNLGTWTVKIDDCVVYTGQANVLRECSFVTKESGVCKIDISANDVPIDVMDALDGNMGILLEIGSGTSGFINVIDKDEKPKATVSLYSGNTSTYFSVATGREDEFNKLINNNGWEKVSTYDYVKEIDFYTNYNDIISMWNDAVADGLLVNKVNDLQFYKWCPNVNLSTNVMILDENFTPEWFPEEQQVTFSYWLGTNVELTAYGQNVLKENGWELKQEETEFGADESPKYILGTTTNLTDLSEINNALSAECFIFENATFNGWQQAEGKIFIVYPGSTDIYNSALVSTITVILSGMVVDEAGKGMPNVCVAFKPLGDTQHNMLQSRGQTVKDFYPTVTDANGNYWLPVDKGLTGIMYFGISIFDNTDNEWSGKSLLLDNVQAQNIPTIVVKTKVLLHVVKDFPEDNSNSQILDYGEIKFVNANGEVFYQSTDENNAEIEVYANDSGKLIYESALYYGELDIENTSAASEILTLPISKKNPETDADCLIKGVAYLVTGVDIKVPLANAHLDIFMFDPGSNDYYTINVVTNENGEYSFKDFQGAVIEMVNCTTSGGDQYSITYKNTMIYGDIFEFDIDFVSLDNEIA